MNRKVFCFSLLSLTIAACSNNSATRHQAEGDFDYAKRDEAKSLITPADLFEAKKSKSFIYQK